ncbi:MAG TPA: 16S rRNA (cytosine(1402)-N(4))-methyltransferase RsmH [Verrucomicrobiales bacterium]|nr:16S rRNA (cytosine(1402)-N(4))-methyltransferase RsmH [Verrucomicrobiales bacterium]
MKDWLTGRRQTQPPGTRWTNLTASEGHGHPAPEGEDLEGIYHIPVMPDEVVEWLAPDPGKLIMDCTFGGGGHTRRLLASGAGVLALDRDADALMQAAELAGEWPFDFVALRTTYDQYPAILEEAGVTGVDGILLDVGVSSWQVDSPNRGFSFRFDGPLDMRMDRDAPLTAEEIVNTWPQEELARIFYTYGEEKASRRVAAAIEARRKKRAITTTAELAELVATVVPKHSGAHPATKVFQALRIAVNDELGCLERALTEAHRWLRPGGRLAVITFHSLEDRLVKNYMRKHSEPFVDRPEWPAARPNPECFYRLPVRKAITASEAELAANPRARSAKLRIAERIS